MNKLWQIYSYELSRNIRRKGFLFATIGLPVIAFIFLMGYDIYQNLSQDGSSDSNPLAALSLESLEKAAYVDHSGMFATVPERLAVVLTRYPDEESALGALEAGEIDAFLVIPDDYQETGDIVLHLPNLSMMLIIDGESVAEQLVYSTLASTLDEFRLRRLSNPVNFLEYDLSLEGGENGTSEAIENGKFLVVYVFTMLFFISLMLTNTYLMQTVIEERENSLIEIIISTVRPTQLLSGKILAMATLGIIQILVWLVSSGLLINFAGSLETYASILTMLNVDFRVDLLPLAIVYFVLMYFLYASVFGTIGALSGSSQEGSQYAGFVIIPTIIPFYFFPLIQTDSNGLIAVVLSLLPVTSPVTILMRMVIGIVPIWQVALSIILSLLITIAAMWMAGRIFRVQTLLSGQKLKPSDLPRLLFAENAPRKAKQIE
jgi:ABC-2 type transport system permease protein